MQAEVAARLAPALREVAAGAVEPFPVAIDEAYRQIAERPRVSGKFLFAGDEKFWVRGVTYGTFRPGAESMQYPPPAVVDEDLGRMAAAGLNCVRVYTVPPRWLLDLASRHGLRVIVGLPWEQHVTFLDDPVCARDIVDRVRQGVRQCAGHPAVLCYAVGNEIPASIARWHGARQIERFLRRLYCAAKAEDPGALVTYVNYPSTEYLDLSFFDFVAFNVYLETPERLSAYLSRLQNIAGERPLVLAEIGLDSRRNGEERQAEVLRWQIVTSFAGGCAGTVLFAWTDEWYRGGHEIEDWDFGLTDRDRRPKAALSAVRDAFAEVPFPHTFTQPRVSVVVCSYNGSATIGETLAGLQRLDYPDYEVIVVDDGSIDATATIAADYPVRLIRTENRGLSAARNTGLGAATGEIVAYIDDDAYPDPHWLAYLAARFAATEHAAIGGPNIAPPGDGPVAECVASAPGGPTHILLTDEVAEHIPGCNMAFRRDRLRAIGGFDPRFRVAGDDVDVCWSLQEQGWTLGFAPAAVVWHHRRASIRRYWRQQRGYAHAEALLADKWPSKYNEVGHLTWSGRIYGTGLPGEILRRQWIYHGVWGSALFQSVYEPARGLIASLPLMPEWYAVILVLAGLSALGLAWAPLLWLLPLFGAALIATLAQAVAGARRARFPSARMSSWRGWSLRVVTVWLYLIQPLARLLGRVRYGLGPWRRGRSRGPALTWPRLVLRELWSESWHPPEDRLAKLEEALRRSGAAVARGGVFDSWDLEIRGGLLGRVRTMMVTEEHGGGRQLFRLRTWPHMPAPAVGLALLLAAVAALAALDAAWLAAASLAALVVGLAARVLRDYATAHEAWELSLARVAGATLDPSSEPEWRLPLVPYAATREGSGPQG